MNYKCMFPPGSCCTLTGPGCAWQATGAESVAVAVPSRAPQPAAAAGMSSMPAQRCFPRGSSSLLRAWLASPWSPRFKHRCLASAAYVQVLFLKKKFICKAPNTSDSIRALSSSRGSSWLKAPICLRLSCHFTTIICLYCPHFFIILF